MATENPRVWFKSISLENVRSFGTKQTINFIDKDGNAARWNVILGDNGTGKTTVLKGLVYSYLAVSELFDERSDLLGSLMRNEGSDLQIWAEFLIENNTIFKHHFLRTRDLKLAFEKLKEEQDKVGIKHQSIKKIQVFGYGASRRIGYNSDTKNDFYSETDAILESIITLFRDDKNLLNAEEWLIQADYLAYRNEKLRGRYQLVYEILRKIFENEVSNIYIDTESGTPKVFFKTHYGDVRLHELSLGYKTLIAWMVDFARGLLDRYPESKNPLAEPAVCLVDEIDLHLHPKFQRTIIKFLTETFTNTQFIVTAHSPLIVVAVEERPLDANIILLKREGDQTVVVNDPVDVNKWSVDQILNSDLFGHVPARSEPLTALRTERDTLLAKPKLTERDNTRLAELDEKIGFVPSGQDQAEIQAETIIQQLADVLRKQQQAQ